MRIITSTLNNTVSLAIKTPASREHSAKFTSKPFNSELPGFFRPYFGSSNVQATPKFGAIAGYKGPFNTLWLSTDFKDGTSNGAIIRRFRDVQAYASLLTPESLPSGFVRDRAFDQHEQTAQSAGFLDIQSLSDIPFKNIDYAGLTLLRLAGGEANKNIYIHVTDPAVGAAEQGNERSILVSQNHGILIGPNNGSLALIAEHLEVTGDRYKLLAIDLEKVRAFEASRRPGVPLANTFHGRDVFAVVAGAIAAGVAPESFAKPESIRPVGNEFAKPVRLSRRPVPVQIKAVQDNTAGNLKLNVALTQAEFDTFVKEGVSFLVTNPVDPTRLKLENIPASKTFKDVEAGDALIYLGSTEAPGPGKRYLELAINLGDAGKALGLDPANASAATLNFYVLHPGQN
ncbi:MAG: SAM-dependent chlorinase/fluorinase [Cyanobacteria bacterium]|nr:SAM-dependent chlorinase/fluorinase [Cyanobacteriota bacterium]